jgi:MraZ protein
MGFAGEMPGEAEAAFAGFTNRFRLYRREVYDAELAEDEEDDIDPLTLVGRHKRTG